MPTPLRRRIKFAEILRRKRLKKKRRKFRTRTINILAKRQTPTKVKSLLAKRQTKKVRSLFVKGGRK